MVSLSAVIGNTLDKIRSIFGNTASGDGHEIIIPSALPQSPTIEDPPGHYETWEFSKQYSTVNSEGGQKPPPACGSPTFVWHLGIWQRASADEAETAPKNGDLQDRFTRFDEHNSKFFKEIDDFIAHLPHMPFAFLGFPAEDNFLVTAN